MMVMMVMVVRKDNQPLLHFHGKTLLPLSPRKTKKPPISFVWSSVSSPTTPWHVHKLSVKLGSSYDDGFA